MRNALISFIAVVGCAAAVGASQQNVDNTLSTTGIDKAASELIHPVVALARLIDEVPDGADVIGRYQAVRTVADVEEANAQLSRASRKISLAHG